MCRVMEELRIESFAEGREEGLEKGREEQSRLIAKNLKKQGWTAQQIAQTVGFDAETVTQWLEAPES